MANFFDCTNRRMRIQARDNGFGEMFFHQELGMIVAPNPPAIMKGDYIFTVHKCTAGHLAPFLIVAETGPVDDAGDVNQGYRDWSTITWKVRFFKHSDYATMNLDLRALFLKYSERHGVRHLAEQCLQF